MSIAQLIQRQIPLDSPAQFTTSDGAVVSGVLVEVGRNHVTIEDEHGEQTTLLVATITRFTLRKPSESIMMESKIVAPPPHEQKENSETKVDLAIRRQLIEIEARYRAEAQFARIEIEPPDLQHPDGEFRGKHQVKAIQIWNQIVNIYKNAQRINELGTKFGRIQPILGKLATLEEWYPSSEHVKRHQAYFQWLAGQRDLALASYKILTTKFNRAVDWWNLAAIAITNNDPLLACYALAQHFRTAVLEPASSAWYVFVRLMAEHHNHPLLNQIYTFRRTQLNPQETRLFWETAIYLIQQMAREPVALQLLSRATNGDGALPIGVALNYLERQLSSDYQELEKSLSELVNRPAAQLPADGPGGHVYTYKSDHNYGFIRDHQGGNYFFHISAVIDDELLEKMKKAAPGQQFPVTFTPTQGPKGPLALDISQYRTLDQLYALAIDFANVGDYPKANEHIKRVLTSQPDYKDAQTLYEQWREYARVSGVPKGGNPYARAKRAELVERNLERAAELYRLAIKQNDTVESAIKDLAMLLDRQGKPKDAIKVLQSFRQHIQDQKTADNILIGLYRHTEEHDKAITLLERRLSQEMTNAGRAKFIGQIAGMRMQKKDYAEAELDFREMLMLQPDNLIARRNLAISLFQQERHGEAERLLNAILDESPDTKAAELLEAIHQAQATGHSSQIDQMIVETALDVIPYDSSGEISPFSRFYLDHCEYKGVWEQKVKDQVFNRKDLEDLDRLIAELGVRRPRDRADYNLSAAKISLRLDGVSEQFYRYLYRSFVSRGDAAILNGRTIDTAREYFCEALNAYDFVRKSRNERDVVMALVFFLYSALGSTQVDIHARSTPSLDDTIEDIVTKSPNRTRVFDSMTYAMLRSRFATNQILSRLYNKSSLQATALDYLRDSGVLVPPAGLPFDEFARLWSELRRKRLDELRSLITDFMLLRRVEMSVASLTQGIERLKTIANYPFYETDRQRVGQLRRILTMALELCSRESFSAMERLCQEIDARCQDLIGEIEAAPTRLSLEDMLPVVKTVQEKTKVRLENIYQSSSPNLIVRLPRDSFTPVDRQIQVQIAVSNAAGCSPVEALELVIQPDDTLYTLRALESKHQDLLDGGKQHIFVVPIEVHEPAMQARAFSLPVYVQYRTRTEETARTPVSSHSIRLTAAHEFIPIRPNPYAQYAEGGPVGESAMFFGRGGLINNVAEAIVSSMAQSKAIVIFGQKRAGKTSILLHLEKRLRLTPNLLVLHLGNVASFVDPVKGDKPLMHQLLWGIVKELAWGVQDRIKAGAVSLPVTFPDDLTFYAHPSPLSYFRDIFKDFQRVCRQLPNWQHVRVVLLLDEFSYIYDLIVHNQLDEFIMRNWKALLQENFFHVVLAGQDVMPKFKQRFPNEFGTTQDERITYLKEEDARQLIDVPIRIGGPNGESRYLEHAIDHIIELTAGSPFYTQLLCKRLVDYMNESRAPFVTEADVRQVKDLLIGGNNRLDIGKFDNLLNSGDISGDAISNADALVVLTAIAYNSRIGGVCDSASITGKTSVPIVDILQDLERRDVIECTRGHYYSIRVGLFREWLVKRYEHIE